MVTFCSITTPHSHIHKIASQRAPMLVTSSGAPRLSGQPVINHKGQRRRKNGGVVGWNPLSSPRTLTTLLRTWPETRHAGIGRVAVTDGSLERESVFG